jgi:anti-sigma factor RsiW
VGGRRLLRGLSLLATVALALALSASAAAHEQRQVGPYTLEVGWRDEPALAGLQNAVEVEVRELATGHGVDGLAKTLVVSVSFGGSRAVFVPELRSLGAADPGHYTADIIRPPQGITSSASRE